MGEHVQSDTSGIEHTYGEVDRITDMTDSNEPDMGPQDSNTNATTSPEATLASDLTKGDLIQNLRSQWSQNLAMGQKRRATYTEMGQIIEFMNCHDSEQASREEQSQLGNLETSLLTQWRDVLHMVVDE